MKENIITEAFADTLEFLAFKMRNGEPAYIAGDSARDLADVICALGCRCG